MNYNNNNKATIYFEKNKWNNEILTKIKSLLKEYKNNISYEGSYSDFIKKLDNLNNRQLGGIEEAFEKLNIKLNEDDKKIINYRNFLFHGEIEKILKKKISIRIEKNSSEVDYEIMEYSEPWIYSYRVYMLMAKLILKMIKYDGYLFNSEKYILKTLYNSIEVEEDFFIKVE